MHHQTRTFQSGFFVNAEIIPIMKIIHHKEMIIYFTFKRTYMRVLQLNIIIMYNAVPYDKRERHFKEFDYDAIKLILN